MANTFSSVVDTIFARSLLALRNAATMPRLVRTDWSNEVAQAGDTINVPLPPTLAVSDVSPSSTPLAQANHTRNVVAIPLSNWRKTSMTLTDKEAREMADGARAGDIGSAMSVLAEDVNSKIMALYKQVYGYAGVAGTTPFLNDLAEAIAAQRVLFDQKCPMDSRRIVIGGAAQAAALNLNAVQAASVRGDGQAIKTGQIGTLIGFDWNADQQVPTHTAGTADTLLVNDAAFAAGVKTVTVDGEAAGTVLAGDIFTVAGDTQTYVVVSSVGGAAPTSITFEPAAQVAWANDAAITLKASHVANLAFHKDAFALATRPLAPVDGFSGGNMIRSEMDPESGLGITLEVSRQHMQTIWVWSILFGVKCIRPELACRIAG